MSHVSPYVRDLLDRMSLAEKAGQMTQVTIDLILEDDSNLVIDEKKLRQAVVERKVGSILNTRGHAYSVEKWHEIMTRIQTLATGETPNSIPVLYGIDSIHGATYTLDSTLFPHNISLGATRDRALVKKAAKITAMETRASGIRWNFDPVLDVARQPLWSRFEETFGEDTYLVGELGVSTIQGFEEDGLASPSAVASCMKHFLGYGDARSGKDRTPSYIPDTQLREIFLPPFIKAVETGTATVMINSGEVNGIPVHANPKLLTEMLRGELGFEGLAVTDWEDIIRLHTRHRVADTPKEAVRLAILAGVDMSMVPFDYDFTDYLIELVEEGAIPMSRIDEAVGRILSLKVDVGLFENPFPEEEATALFGREEYTEVALTGAIDSLILAKNENQLLPLAAGTKVLLAGPGAHSLPALHGSWSYTWQGNFPEHYPQNTLSIKQAMEAHLGADQVLCDSKADFTDPGNVDPSFLLSAADKADVIVLALGENSYAETPGNINDLDLDADQQALAKAAFATGKPVILVMVQGRPRVMREIEPQAGAIILAMRPGSQAGPAIASTLFGEANPSGRLSFSYPRHNNDHISYDHKLGETIQEPQPGHFEYTGYNPQWAFGHGLSYTTFAYDQLQLSSETLKEGESLILTVQVTNTGDRAGKHSVEVYSRDLFASITPSVRRLRGFEKIELQAGESRKVEFTFQPADFSFIDAHGKRIVEPGEFVLTVGALEVGFHYQA
ncbi:MAG: glycoside hydrolase family 3 N-terminal domain-containing protein [Bacteroidota bacterium]